MDAAKKITVHVPADLLRRAQEMTGEGITSTVTIGLQLVAASRACKELLELRGSVRFSVSLDELRKDRE